MNAPKPTPGNDRLPDSREVVVTGSSGFIGAHLCAELANGPDGGTRTTALDICSPTVGRFDRFEKCDIRRPEALRLLSVRPHTVVHLAAEAEALVPFGDLGALLDTNVVGTLNVLQTLDPSLLLFASSSAVYGHAVSDGVTEQWENVHPVGSYGMSKAGCEILCRDWALATNASAISFRFGNVVGTSCRGLIPYLVRHAKAHPQGDVPARARGEGRIVRDYVPVAYVVNILQAAMTREWGQGKAEVFNIGCGRGLTNREVAEIVGTILTEQGYVLHVDWSARLPAGESRSVVLDMTRTQEIFGRDIPSHDEVVAAIEDSARYWIAAEVD